MQTEPPAFENSISMEARVRQAVAAEIRLRNPLKEKVYFDVILNGEGIIGETVLDIPAKEEAT